MKILVVGAGGQGGPCASILARDEEIAEIRLGDINFELAGKVAEKINSRKVEPLLLNAADKQAVVEAALGVDAIINLTLIDFNEIIIEAALANKCHYVDTACTAYDKERETILAQQEYQMAREAEQYEWAEEREEERRLDEEQERYRRIFEAQWRSSGRYYGN